MLVATLVNALTDDGLAACPICNRRMKEVDVFGHLDTHQEGGQQEIKSPRKSPNSSTASVPHVWDGAVSLTLSQITFQFSSGTGFLKAI
jgi:predicted nucleic acid-binding Zn ribbon protein